MGASNPHLVERLQEFGVTIFAEMSALAGLSGLSGLCGLPGSAELHSRRRRLSKGQPDQATHPIELIAKVLRTDNHASCRRASQLANA